MHQIDLVEQKLLSKLSVVPLALASVLFCVSYITAQPETTGPTPARKSTRINLYHHLGSVELPPDFRGVVEANWNDAWGGILESPVRRIRIGWRAGTIQYVAEDKKRGQDIVWQKVEESSELPIKLTLFRDYEGTTLVARIGWLEFNTLLVNADDEDVFMSVVRSYQKERCSKCRSLPIRSVY